MHGLYIIDEPMARLPAIGITLLTLCWRQPDDAGLQSQLERITSVEEM